MKFTLWLLLSPVTSSQPSQLVQPTVIVSTNWTYWAQFGPCWPFCFGTNPTKPYQSTKTLEGPPPPQPPQPQPLRRRCRRRRRLTVEPADSLPFAVLSSQRYTLTLRVAPSMLEMLMGVRYLNIWACRVLQLLRFAIRFFLSTVLGQSALLEIMGMLQCLLIIVVKQQFALNQARCWIPN